MDTIQVSRNTQQLQDKPAESATAAMKTSPAAELEQESVLSDQLERWHRRPPLSLYLPPGLEGEFTRDRHERFIPVARFTLALAVISYLSFLLLDGFVFHHYAGTPIVWFMVLFGALPCLLMFGFTYLPNHARWYSAAAQATLILNGVYLSIHVNWGRALGVDPPAQMLTMQMFYIYFFLGIRFATAVPLVLLIAASYTASMLFIGFDPYRTYEESYLYVATGFMGAVAARLTEFSHRKVWLQKRSLKVLSERDALTGLANRRVFYEHCGALLNKVRRSGDQFGLALIDLDHFKAYNDSFGHVQGDDCLRRVAKALASQAQRDGDLVARLGGEEFAVIWQGADRAVTRAKGEGLLETIRRESLAHPRGIGGIVTASIGLWCEEDGAPRTAQQVVAAADHALYAAKAAGRNELRAAWLDNEASAAPQGNAAQVTSSQS